MNSTTVTIGVGKKAKDYRIRFDHNAFADLEQAAGMGLSQLFQREMGFAAVRLMLWAGLKHMEPGITLQRAGDLIATYCRKADDKGNGGTLDDLQEALMKAVDASGLFKKAQDDDEDESPAGDGDEDEEPGEGEAKAEGK